MAKVMLSIPNEFLKEIDRISQIEHRSRSEFLREAVRHYLVEIKKSIETDIFKVKVALKVQEQIAKKIKGEWDSAEFFREWRDKR